MNDYTDPEVNILYSESSTYSTRAGDEASLQVGNNVTGNVSGGGL